MLSRWNELFEVPLFDSRYSIQSPAVEKNIKNNAFSDLLQWMQAVANSSQKKQKKTSSVHCPEGLAYRQGDKLKQNPTTCLSSFYHLRNIS